jgi:hypothetical protein
VRLQTLYLFLVRGCLSEHPEQRGGMYAFFAGFFLIMFRVPTLVLAATTLSLGIYLFHRFYYLSEYIVHQEDELDDR